MLFLQHMWKTVFSIPHLIKQQRQIAKPAGNIRLTSPAKTQ